MENVAESKAGLDGCARLEAKGREVGERLWGPEEKQEGMQGM